MRLLFITVIIIISCKNEPKVVFIDYKLNCEESGCFDVQHWRKELILIDSIKINNTIPLISSFLEYKLLFGPLLESYLIENEDIALYDGQSKMKNRHIFKGMVVDQLGNNAIINSVDLRVNPIKLYTKNIVLQKGTKISEVSKFFPNSTRLMNVNEMSGSGYVELKTHMSGYDTRRIVLIFRKDELIKIKIIKHKLFD